MCVKFCKFRNEGGYGKLVMFSSRDQHVHQSAEITRPNRAGCHDFQKVLPVFCLASRIHRRSPKTNDRVQFRYPSPSLPIDLGNVTDIEGKSCRCDHGRNHQRDARGQNESRRCEGTEETSATTDDCQTSAVICLSPSGESRNIDKRR